MKINKIILAICILCLIATVIIYPFLPPEIPGHWGINGEVDRYDPSYTIFIAGSLPLLLYLFLLFAPKIDPRKENYKNHQKAYSIICGATACLLVAVWSFVVLTSFGIKVPVGKLTPAFMGILFIVIGNYLPQAKPNFFFGIRTPWTLSDPEVWRRTHRLGGWFFVAFGIIMLLQGVYTTTVIFMSSIVAILAGSFLMMGYSYLLWRKIVKN